MKFRGFTLIELMVVVAIIGLLSSVVIGGVRTARAKASDAAIRSDLRQLATTAELQRSMVGDFTGISQYGWVWTAEDCDSSFSGPFAAKARATCKHVLQQNTNRGFFSGVSPSFSDTGTFSYMAYLPGMNKWMCVGSTGTSVTTPNPIDNYDRSGCYNNP